MLLPEASESVFFRGFGLNYADCLDYYIACDAIPDQPEDVSAPHLVLRLISLKTSILILPTMILIGITELEASEEL